MSTILDLYFQVLLLLMRSATLNFFAKQVQDTGANLHLQT